MVRGRVRCGATLAWVIGLQLAAGGQQPRSVASRSSDSAADGETGIARVPPDYVIGVADVLSIVFWRDPDMSAEVMVRPDGKISLPILKEIPAAGYTPAQLGEKLVEAASEYLEDPTPTVVVKEIRSRNVFITGSVTKPNTYPLMANMTVVQLIALAGGLEDFADAKHIVIMRMEQGKQQYYAFNYKDVIHRKHREQNILLKAA